jgi:hypothetical protein
MCDMFTAGVSHSYTVNGEVSALASDALSRYVRREHMLICLRTLKKRKVSH